MGIRTIRSTSFIMFSGYSMEATGSCTELAAGEFFLSTGKGTTQLRHGLL
jgi:hypothetical protein